MDERPKAFYSGKLSAEEGIIGPGIIASYSLEYSIFSQAQHLLQFARDQIVPITSY